MKPEKLVKLVRATIRQELSEYKLNFGNPVQEDKLYTRKEVMQELKLSSTSVWKMCRSGELKFTRIGRKLYFSKSAIDHLFSQN
ncbi:MAG: helix-turn-helix domain-containing protein [Candidatus Kapabacteria bacterium]|nr:helix-turn-helix domain-containing protein [Ignavibacteriota bacterium]MCW5885380.1 helix-turn-helix domain-containing protein [Candidatus Kapabacteria bacterium]